jgi:RNA polymerase sigma factor (sigma-70 family)
VWAVCRHLAGPDAEDAFQATFLVLLRNAGRVRHPDSLPAWLHGVAYRVSSKARRAARRRAARERAAAVPDRDGRVVPDSAWDRALAAVHEEVGRLPEALRVPFVLCALEGRTVSEAAGHLGWKVTTLSARLRRAKDALLARLQARGLAAGAVVAVAVAAEAVPRAVASWTVAAAGGGPVGETIRSLTHGVVGMSAHQVKLLAAGVLLALGLGVGGGAGWLAPAGAQVPAPERTLAVTAEERVKQLEAQLDRAKRELADQRAADRRKAADEAARLTTARWEYAFVPVRDVAAEAFGQVLRDREDRGWEYAGQATLKKEAVWAFRRPLGGALGGPTTSAANHPPTPLPAGGYPPLAVPGTPAADPPAARTGGYPTPPGMSPGGARR